MPWPTPGRHRNLIEPLARLIGTMPGYDPAVELENLSLQNAQLHAQSGDAHTRRFGDARVAWTGGDSEQLLDAIAADPRDDPELGKMGADRVDHAGLLFDEQMARSVEH